MFSITSKGEMSVNLLPLTPPSTVEKKVGRDSRNRNVSPIKPKKLLNELKNTELETKLSPTKSKHTTRRLKYRPEPNTVMEIDDGLYEKPSEKRNLDYLKSVLQESSNIIMVTGAGISTYAGISDFRSQQNGLYTKNKMNKSLFDLNLIYSSEDSILKFNQLMNGMYHKAITEEPTPFHRMINEIATQGRLKRSYTQNIDALETKLSHLNTETVLSNCKKPYPKLIQLHGTITKTRCNKCNHVTEMDPSRFKDNSNDSNHLIPPCKECEEIEAVRSIAGIRSKGVGFIRPMVTLYNEQHQDGESIADIMNYDVKDKTVDSLIIVGTTLSIPHVKKLCQNFTKKLHGRRQNKGNVIFVSNEMPSQNLIDSFDGGLDLIVLGDCQILSKFV